MGRQFSHANEESMKFLQGLGGTVPGAAFARLCRKTQLTKGSWCSVLTSSSPARVGARDCTERFSSFFSLVLPVGASRLGDRECVFYLLSGLAGPLGLVFSSWCLIVLGTQLLFFSKKNLPAYPNLILVFVSLD